MPRNLAVSTAATRLAAVCAVGAVAVVCAAPAAAHVRADDGQQPPQGGYGLVTLIVPTESDTASTVALTVTFPDEVDLSSARTLPIAGWSASVETEPDGDGTRVARIVWTADGDAGLGPSEFGEFTFSAGPWPSDVETVALVSDQTYSDGSVVPWNEVAVDAASEPQHPAPVVTLGAADSHSDDHGHGEQHATVDVAASASGGDSWFWRATSLVSLVIALATAGALVAVLRRSRDTGSP